MALRALMRAVPSLRENGDELFISLDTKTQNKNIGSMLFNSKNCILFLPETGFSFKKYL